MRLGKDRGAARSNIAVVSQRPCPVPRLTMFGRSPKPVKIQVFAKTDLGKTRDHNEDRFLVADLTRGEASLQPAVREHEVGERGSLFIVADGMGGAAAGELASEMATETIYEQMTRMWGNEKDVTPQRSAYRLKQSVEVANSHIHSNAKAHPDRKSTRLNSSHGYISYAVFCLKKKKKN